MKVRHASSDLIDDADRLTIGAANALLKTLEEPPGHGLFILVSSRPQALPITIRSRCQSLRFTPPAQTQVEAAVILKRELPPAEARFLALVAEGAVLAEYPVSTARAGIGSPAGNMSNETIIPVRP